ncbi:MAG: hypothetical protein JWP44_1245 [Mucilaginibacter sp.]|nr:hypothetical protein [Mucilaginibacter sp.]
MLIVINILTFIDNLYGKLVLYLTISIQLFVENSKTKMKQKLT